MLLQVLTLSNNGIFVPAQPTAHMARSRRECIELLFDDGRKLVCTPEHRIRTAEPDGWCRADELVAGETRVQLGIEGPLYDPSEDLPHCNTFKFKLDGVRL